MKIVLMTLILSGCATVGVTKINSAPEKGLGCELTVYTSEKEITSPYEVLCLIDSRTSTRATADTTMAGAINIARDAACKCGATGLLVISGATEGDGFWIPRTGTAVLKAIRIKP